MPLSLVFGLSLTCELAFSSAFFSSESPESAPFAEAFASVALSIVEVAVMSKEAAVMFRATTAVVDHFTMTLIATLAPTAVSSLAAVASPLVLEASIVCVAETMTAPDGVHAPVPVPMRARTTSSTSSASATAGVTAVPPFEPALTSVSTVRVLLALTVTAAPPASATPSSISALVSVEKRMFSAMDAPTPTSSPSASASAFALSDSRWDALTLTAPVPALMSVVVPE